MKAFDRKLSDCKDLIENFKCKCDNAEYESGLFALFHDRIFEEFQKHFTSNLNEEIDKVRTEISGESAKLTGEMTEMKESICEKIQKCERDLVDCMTEIQEMLNAKFNKCDFLEWENYLSDELSRIEEKIDNVECKRAVAAGITKKIFKDINCVSCGERVIQIDDVSPPQMMIKNTPQEQLFLENTKLSSRLCGGKHTIITPSERVFRNVTKS